MTEKKETKERLISVQPEILHFVDKSELTSLDYDQLVEMGRGIGEVKTYANWLLGKLASSVTVKYGDLIKYAKDIGQNYDVLAVYASTYNKYIKENPNFTPDDYYGRVPWGLIQLVASKSDTPGKLLGELADKGVTSIEAGYREIRGKETGVQVPKKPSVRLVWDGVANKWKIKINLEDLPLIDWGDVKQQLITYLSSLN